MKLSILITTGPEQRSNLLAVIEQAGMQDYKKEYTVDCVVLNDTGSEIYTPNYFEKIDVPGAPLGHWGHAARNWWLQQQEPDPDRLIWHIDDDDTLANDAAAIIMQTAKPGMLNIYRYYHRRHKKLYWHTQGAAMLNNVGTPCGVHPIVPDMPRFELYRGGDGAFFQALAERMPVQWVDEVIYFV